MQSIHNKISVVIPNFNGLNLLKSNLSKIVDAKNNIVNNILEIIVVDDASTDESVLYLRKNYPEIKIIKHSVNRGFSGAVNTGVRNSRGEFVALLNTDVIPSEDFLLSMIDHFKDKSLFAVSMHEKNMGFARGLFIDGFIEIPGGVEAENMHTSFYVSGGSGVFRKKIWNDLGGMDEKLLSPYYWEDIDLSYRASKRGYKLLWNPESKVEHIHETTISTLPVKPTVRILERNRLLVIWKNITSPRLIRRHLWGLSKRLMHHPGYVVPIFMALGRIGTVLQKRKIEIKEAKISDEAIFASHD